MIKILSGSLREYKRGSILTILLSILEAAFEILIPLRMADLIDQGIDLGDMAAAAYLHCPRCGVRPAGDDSGRGNFPH